MNTPRFTSTLARCRNLILAGCLLPSLAMAHPGHYHPGEKDEFDSLVSGMLHPFSGLDHFLIALAAGGIAMAMGKRLGLTAAVSFLVALAAGAFIGHGLGAGTALEAAIACTLLATGTGLLAGRVPPVSLLITALALIGGIHGFAHGAEAPRGFPIGMLAFGWVAATAVLMGLGAMLHQALITSRRAWVPRMAGTLLVAVGIVSFLHHF